MHSVAASVRRARCRWNEGTPGGVCFTARRLFEETWNFARSDIASRWMAWRVGGRLRCRLRCYDISYSARLRAARKSIDVNVLSAIVRTESTFTYVIAPAINIKKKHAPTIIPCKNTQNQSSGVSVLRQARPSEAKRRDSHAVFCAAFNDISAISYVFPLTPIWHWSMPFPGELNSLKR